MQFEQFEDKCTRTVDLEEFEQEYIQTQIHAEQLQMEVHVGKHDKSNRIKFQP